MVNKQINLSLPLVKELTDNQDRLLKSLENHLPMEIFLRGDVLTLRGSQEEVELGSLALAELEKLSEQDIQIVEGTVHLLLESLQAHEDPGTALGEVIWSHRQISITPKTLNQKAYLESLKHNPITFAIGPAGSGKSFLAVAYGLKCLRNKEVSKLVLSRPALEAGEKLGYLPGDLRAKVDPYLQPLYDALQAMLDVETVHNYLERGIIEIAPLAFMRGRTFNDAFIIADEMQNASFEQLKMILTRIGFNTRLAVTGDITQIDLPLTQPSGLIGIEGILKEVKGIGFVRLESQDVVRHKLVQQIVAAYEQYLQKLKKD